MLQCWKAKPTLRPSFTDLVESIGDLLEDSVKSVSHTLTICHFSSIAFSCHDVIYNVSKKYIKYSYFYK